MLTQPTSYMHKSASPTGRRAQAQVSSGPFYTLSTSKLFLFTETPEIKSLPAGFEMMCELDAFPTMLGPFCFYTRENLIQDNLIILYQSHKIITIVFFTFFLFIHRHLEQNFLFQISFWWFVISEIPPGYRELHPRILPGKPTASHRGP